MTDLGLRNKKQSNSKFLTANLELLCISFDIIALAYHSIFRMNFICLYNKDIADYVKQKRQIRYRQKDKRSWETMPPIVAIMSIIVY